MKDESCTIKLGLHDSMDSEEYDDCLEQIHFIGSKWFELSSNTMRYKLLNYRLNWTELYLIM